MHALSRPVLPCAPLLALALLCAACATSSGDGDGQHGALQLGLTTQAAGVSYRLTAARFTLDGPEPREFNAPDEVERLELELPQGAYRLTLHEGFLLARSDAPDAGAVQAKLVSTNPALLTISPGETTRVALRFELVGNGAEAGGGKLAINVEVGPADGGMTQGSCARPRINELDYEQEGTDEAEFIELINTGCSASLADLTVELVNGGDGKVYGRYPLTDITLATNERLVIGDANVLSQLPTGVKTLPLNASGLQNGPDGVRIVRGEVVLDAVAYEGLVTGVQEGEPTAADDGVESLGRCPDAFDSDNNASDFRLGAPTPGAANAC